MLNGCETRWDVMMSKQASATNHGQITEHEFTPEVCEGKLPDSGNPAVCPYCHKPLGNHPRKRTLQCPFCAGRIHREGQTYFTVEQFKHRHNRCFFCGGTIAYPHQSDTTPFTCPHCGGVMEWPEPKRFPRGYGKVVYMCLTCHKGKVYVLGDIAHADRPALVPRRPMPVRGKCYFCQHESDFVYTENVDRILTTKAKPRRKGSVDLIASE